MLKSNKLKFARLEKFYLFIVALVLISVILTPYMIKRGFSFLFEETVETIFITLLLAVGVFVANLYRKEIQHRQNTIYQLESAKASTDSRLDEAMRYIGKVNVYINEVHSAFGDISHYPENKQDFKRIMEFTANKVLSAVNSPWVVLKIIDTDSGRTLKELAQARAGAIVVKHEFGNKDLLEDKVNLEYHVVRTAATNVSSQVFCILAKSDIGEDQRKVLETIITELQMMFLIFASQFYRFHS